jgi:hypothetical protein
MQNFSMPGETNPNEQPTADKEVIIYPPKFQ